MKEAFRRPPIEEIQYSLYYIQGRSVDTLFKVPN